jgi:pyrroline-5-carboxylate reductase
VKRLSAAVIGGGHMGRALIGGWIRAKQVRAGDLHVAEPDPVRAGGLKKDFKVRTFADNRAAVENVSVVLLAVKPQVMAGVLDGLRGAVTPRQLVLSVAAGVRLETLEAALGVGVPVVRVMPNTPALAGAGAMVYCLGRSATAAHERTAPEDLMDAVTALSGSGPAYVFRLAEDLAAAGVFLGLPDDLAAALARQTVYGAGLLLRDSPESAATLRERVTSPGGTTAAALAVLAESGWSDVLQRALSAACRRSRELSEGATERRNP